MGLPGPYAGSRIYSPHRRRRPRRRLSDQLEVERLPRDSGADLRPAMRARLPSRTPAGRARRYLPAQARRRRPQERHSGSSSQGPRSTQRQADRLRRRGAGVADRRPRSRRHRLRRHSVRFRRARRRHDAQPDPEVPPPGRSHRRGSRLRAVDRRHVCRLAAHRQPQGDARRRLRRDFRRLRRAPRPRSRRARPPRGRRKHPYRHRLARERVVRPYPCDRTPGHRARRRQYGDGLLPHGAENSAAKTSRSWCGPASPK